MASGSALWQTIFVSFAIVLILFELIRGWRLGLMRQLARLVALLAAYAAAIFGGRLLLPIARPFLKMPDAVIAIIAGVIVALVVYSVISSLGRILFRRTDQQISTSLRVLSGLSGAALGLFFGLLMVWLMVVTIRSLGAVADGQVRGQGIAENFGTPPQAVHAVYSPDAEIPAPKLNEPSNFVGLLARLKNSVERGVVGRIMEKTDPVPQATYDMLGKLGRLLSAPDRAQRFLSYPGVQQLSDNPKIVALRNDPEILDLISDGRVFELLRNDKILAAANDPALVNQIKKLDLRGALDFALGPEQPGVKPVNVGVNDQQ